MERNLNRGRRWKKSPWFNESERRGEGERERGNRGFGPFRYGGREEEERRGRCEECCKKRRMERERKEAK